MRIVVQILHKILRQTATELHSWHFPQNIWPELSLHSLVLTSSCHLQKLIFWESRLQLADSQASACRKHPSVHIGCSSCSCTVHSFFAPIFSRYVVLSSTFDKP
eukprot:s341_g2.t2